MLIVDRSMLGAVRRIMKIQLGTKPVTRRDMEELRSILLDLQLKLNSIIDRIPEGKNLGVSPSLSNRSLSDARSPGEHQNSGTELPGEGQAGCSEQYHTPVLISFHKWARILLSLFIDKVGISVESPTSEMLTCYYEGFLCRISALLEERKKPYLARRKKQV